MRSVPIGEFKDNASAFVAAAEAGEEILVTRHGKPAAKLTAVADDRRARQRAAFAAMVELGRENRAKFGPVTIDEIIEWKNEGRR